MEAEEQKQWKELNDKLEKLDKTVADLILQAHEPANPAEEEPKKTRSIVVPVALCGIVLGVLAVYGFQKVKKMIFPLS